MKSSDCTVRILIPSLDEDSDPLVLRGVIDTPSLPHLLVDSSYQRERLSETKRKEILDALRNRQKLPDIELGMRGERFDIANDEAWADMHDPVYIIDGQQRWSSVCEHLSQYPDDKVRLGCALHFNTTPKFERQRFHVLNLFRKQVSPSVLLRNTKEENQLVATLYGLSKSQRDHVLYGRVCWAQNMSRGELITGMTLAITTLVVHGHMGPILRTSAREAPDALERLKDIAGLPLLRANITAFWDLIDSCFGVRTIHYTKAAHHLRQPFLKTLARLISDHTNFWSPDDKRLQVPIELRRKLSKFPLRDPEIIRLAGASGKAVETLYFQLLQHLNSGKRTKRLRNRAGTILPQAYGVTDEDEDDSETA